MDDVADVWVVLWILKRLAVGVFEPNHLQYRWEADFQIQEDAELFAMNDHATDIRPQVDELLCKVPVIVHSQGSMLREAYLESFID